MRKKMVNIVQPALTSATMTPETFMHEVETKLSQIINKFGDSYGFHNKVIATVRKLHEKAQASSQLPPPAD
jgi:hypothetical protein